MTSAPLPGDHMKEGWGLPASSLSVTLPGPHLLEHGDVLPDVTLAYNTYGRLNAAGDNAVIVGHSLTSNSCVHEWWPEMLGAGRAFALDTDRFFVVCVNYLGSVYGSSSPLSPRPHAHGSSLAHPREDGDRWAADFPLTTIRDNVVLQRALLDRLGVKGLTLAIGGSLGGMLALEWAATYPSYVKRLVAVACCARHT